MALECAVRLQTPADLSPREDRPISPVDAEAGQASPRRLGRGWRIGIVALGVTLVGMACIIIGLTFVQGSWWHSHYQDRALDRESLARIEPIRGQIETLGTAPEAVKWLNAALDPGTDPTSVRLYLMSAEQALQEAGDPDLDEAAKALGTIIQAMRLPESDAEVTPYPAATLEWP